MEQLDSQLNRIRERLSNSEPTKILIFGLGSVGNYLLDYLLSQSEFRFEIHVCGRSLQKSDPDINVLRISNMIRGGLPHKVEFHPLDLNSVNEIAAVMSEVAPDFLVNTSRAYSGLKYGSISWKTVRAYGLWSPLSIKYIRNIMLAYDLSGCGGIVINTSYPDAVNKWIRSAGISPPHFGSGNLNHLVPRIKLAAATIAVVEDFRAIDVTLSTGHFHDVVISKEGHVEGVQPLLALQVEGRSIDIDVDEVYRKCEIAMPIDARRNMMNASSNFEIILKIMNLIRHGSQALLHVPGFGGHLGGYPVNLEILNSPEASPSIKIDEKHFSLKEMFNHNVQSMALDGIEDISEGSLVYTEGLRKKVKTSFGVTIPKRVDFDSIEGVATLIVKQIIQPTLGRE